MSAFMGSVPKKTDKQRATTRKAFKTHSRVLEMRKPGPVTVYDMRTYTPAAQPAQHQAVASRAHSAVEGGTYADAINAGLNE
jgi:hypothetical protein